MKKILTATTLILALLFALATPALAGWQEEENVGTVAFPIGAHTVKPVLDGKIDGDGAYTKIAYRSGDISYAWDDNVPDSEAKAKGLEWELYASYDANNVYILVTSDTKNYFNDLDDGDGNAWQYSAIQVSLADDGDFGGDRLEFGIWRKSNDGGQGGVIWNQHPSAKAEFTPTAGQNYVVALEGNKLIYETVVPVNTFLGYDSVEEGDAIRLNIVVAQADSNNVGHIHTQFSSGCTGDPGKDAELFAKITLGAPLVVVQLDAAAGAKLQGELIGVETGWGGNVLSGRAAAFDGDTATYFDPQNKGDPEYYAGMAFSEPVTLTEIRIHPRFEHPERFEGASIYGWNGGDFDPYTATLIWESLAPAENPVWQVIKADQFLVKGAFSHYAYFNEFEHGDVGEVEFYGPPAPAADGGAAGGGASAPEQPAIGGGAAGGGAAAGGATGGGAASGGSAPKTGDPITLIVLASMASAAGLLVAKNKKRK